MTPMTPTQVKTFARLATLTSAAVTTVRSAVAAAAVYAEAMKVGGETPFRLRIAIGFLEDNLNDASEELLDAASSVAKVRRLLGLSPDEATVDAEAAYTSATEAAELCAS